MRRRGFCSFFFRVCATEAELETFMLSGFRGFFSFVTRKGRRGPFFLFCRTLFFFHHTRNKKKKEAKTLKKKKSNKWGAFVFLFGKGKQHQKVLAFFKQPSNSEGEEQETLISLNGEHLPSGDRGRSDGRLGRHRGGLDGLDDGLGRGQDRVNHLDDAGAGGEVGPDDLGGRAAGRRDRDLGSVLGDDDGSRLRQPALEGLALRPRRRLEARRSLDDVLLEDVLEVGRREQLRLGELGALEVGVKRGVGRREDGEDGVRVVELGGEVGGLDGGGEGREGGVGLDQGERGGGRGCFLVVVFFFGFGFRCG